VLKSARSEAEEGQVRRGRLLEKDDLPAPYLLQVLLGYRVDGFLEGLLDLVGACRRVIPYTMVSKVVGNTANS
jgi:hypothetical protein